MARNYRRDKLGRFASGGSAGGRAAKGRQRKRVAKTLGTTKRPLNKGPMGRTAPAKRRQSLDSYTRTSNSPKNRKARARYKGFGRLAGAPKKRKKR